MCATGFASDRSLEFSNTGRASGTRGLNPERALLRAVARTTFYTAAQHPPPPGSFGSLLPRCTCVVLTHGYDAFAVCFRAELRIVSWEQEIAHHERLRMLAIAVRVREIRQPR